jgi:hypothetical protein
MTVDILFSHPFLLVGQIRITRLRHVEARPCSHQSAKE